MKAWRFYALGDMRLDEVPYPEPQAGWATVKTRVVQPSVTEAVAAMGGATMGVELFKKSIEERAPIQLFGHEFCGEIVELGHGVSALKVGDRVVSRAEIPCHQCELCRSGREARCRKGPEIGWHIPGAFSEYATLPAEALIPVPLSIDDHEAACLQPLSSCVADIAEVGLRLGDSVAIMGQGVMGLNILQLARIAGAGMVIGIDVRESNLRLSRELGSDHQVDATAVDTVEAVRELTHGLGVDIVFECAGGSPAQGLAGSRTLNQALQIVTDAGRVMQVAMFGGPIQFEPDYLRKKSIKYLFPEAPTAKLWQHTVRVVASGQVKLRPTITHLLHGLEKAPEAFEITGNKARYGCVSPAQVVVSRESP